MNIVAMRNGGIYLFGYIHVDVEDVLAQAMCLFASFLSTNDQNML